MRLQLLDAPHDEADQQQHAAASRHGGDWRAIAATSRNTREEAGRTEVSVEKWGMPGTSRAERSVLPAWQRYSSSHDQHHGVPAASGTRAS